MNYRLDDIHEQVRITLDQNQAETPLIAGGESTLELDDVIGQKIIQAAMYLLQHCPLSLIDTTVSLIPQESETDTNGVLTIGAPYDFLRLSIAQMDDWKVPVRVAVTDMDDAYLTTKSRFPGIRPNTSRPLVAITEDDGKQQIEMYGSSGAGHSVSKFRYIAMPEEKDGTMAFPEKLAPALYYYAAGLVAATFKDASAQNLFAMAQNYSGIQPQPQPQK